jgi:hypothetical protein
MLHADVLNKGGRPAFSPEAAHMSGLRPLALLAVVVVCGMGAIFSVDRHGRTIAGIDPSQGPAEVADLPQGAIVPEDSLDEIRKAERSRRAVRPANQTRKTFGQTYDAVLEGFNNGRPSRPKPAEPMPPTSCRSVEPATQSPDAISGPHRVHDGAVRYFVGTSGFGWMRMTFSYTNDRGVLLASPAIDRVELVSLLTDDQPSAYVLDEMATPALARQAKRRPLDEFERLGLDAVRRGEELVWTREAPTRMFGAIRASANCLDCHVNTKEGDLLGAFTYYLNARVDELKVRQ